MPKLPRNPSRIEPITDDIVPYVEDGQIVWKVLLATVSGSGWS
jgi:hypothetical protein